MNLSIPRTRRAGLALALVAAVISGFSVYVNGLALQHAPSAVSFTTAKNVVAAAMVAAALGASSAGRAAPAQLRRLRPMQWLGVVFVGIVGGGLAFALFFEGLARSDAAQAAFVQKSLVLWVALLAVPLLHERLGWQQGLALGALLVGQLMLSGDVASHHPAAGLLFVFAATLLWSIEVVIARALLPLVSPALLGCVRLGVGCAALIAWLALTHSLGQLELVARTQWPLVVVTGVLLAGYVSTWLSALRRAPAVDVTAVLVLGAFITALLSLPAAHVPRGLQVAGMALLLAGVAAVVGTGRMRSAVHAR